MKEQNLVEEFRKIIDNMSDEELERKLKELEPLHNVGPKADDYLEFLEENKQKLKNDPSCWPTDSELYDFSIMQHLVDD